jgi:hypothetical protein
MPRRTGDSPKTAAFWHAQITAAKTKRDKLTQEWKNNVQRYLAKTLGTSPKEDTVIVPLDYANTEQKKALLFFRVPAVTLTPKKPALDAAVPVFQAVLNHLLGRHGVDAKTMMDEVLFDAIVPAGLAVTKIGYEPTVDGTKYIPTGMVDPQTGAPVLAEVPNVIHEQYYWNRISPEKVLIPADFSGSNYDRAPWLGFEFELDFAIAKRRFHLPDDFHAEVDLPIQGLNESEPAELEGQRPRVSGVELWYRLAMLDPAHAHPEAFGTCVLIDGIDEFAVKPQPSRWQKLVTDPQSGKTTIVGMKGNPIHINGVRYVSDSAYPPSDVTMARPQVEELSKGRTQMIRERDRNVPIRGYDRNRVDKETVTKIERAELQAIIGFDGNPTEQITVIGTGRLPRENFEFDSIIKQDLNASWAMGSNQRAQTSTEGSRTATEASIIQSNSDTRLAYEQGHWLDWFVRGAEKLGGLVQLFADDLDYVHVVGPDGIEALRAWDKTTIAGEFAYHALPDTAIRQDAATHRRRALDQFQLLANEPHVNRGELVRWLLGELNIDPRVFKADLPERGPDPMRLQLTIRSESLNPTLPEYPVLKEVMGQSGINISEKAEGLGIALQSKVDGGGIADPALAGVAIPGQVSAPIADFNPGPAQAISPLNKRAFEETGQLPGGGAAMVPGGPPLIPGVQ